MKLIEVLKKELELYQEELTLSQKRIEGIKNESMGELREIIKQEKSLSFKLDKIEDTRQDLVEQYGYSTLKEYIFSLDNEKRDELWSLRQKLIDVLNSIQENNIFSEKLIDISTGTIKKILDNLTQNTEIGYNNKQKKNNVIQRNILNHKV
ncbi:MAG: flagellar protein FlgN [Fusobacteriota bacterium]